MSVYLGHQKSSEAILSPFNNIKGEIDIVGNCSIGSFPILAFTFGGPQKLYCHRINLDTDTRSLFHFKCNGIADQAGAEKILS